MDNYTGILEKYSGLENYSGRHKPGGGAAPCRDQVGGGALGKMVTREERVEEDLSIEEDMRTMRELRRMANSINPMIQMEEDCASKHLSKKLPILDIEVWVREMPRTETQPATKKLYYQYYSKPMASKLLIMEKSAMPARVKRTALTQYGLRILRNCKLELEWEEKAKFLSDFSEQLRMSGYNAKVRAEILQSILEGWDKMVKEQEEGRRPINRAYTWREQERREGKWRKKNTWFKGGKGEFTSVMFCPHTPGGELAKRWREVEERGAASRGWRFRIVELGGRKIS